MPSRVILQDLTGVPAVVDLAVMRDAMAELGGDPARVNPLVPADLVIDHSVQVDRFGTPGAFAFNVEREYERNVERYQLLRWAQTAFRDLRVVPPGTGIVHQVNLEFLATVVADRPDEHGPVAFPDTLVGTDSHTTMINALGVLGYGVGGIEAEAVLLGQPLYQPMPHVVGVRLTGELPRGSTATDLVLVVTELLRAHGVVGAFVEFAGDGLAGLSLADRATISNMSPEFGATATLFPIDDETLAYLRLTGRSAERVALVERYAKDAGPVARAGRRPDVRRAADPRPGDASRRPSPGRAARRTACDRCRGPAGELPDGRVPGRAEAEPAATARRTSPRLDRTTGGTTGADRTTAGVAGRSVGGRRRRRSSATGSVAIAAITSCTNTSQPDGDGRRRAAGPERRRPRPARRRRRSRPRWRPGSKAVTGYLEAAGLMAPLEALGFALAGYGCTTCIGNSGPLDEAVAGGHRGERPRRRGGPVGQPQLRGPHPPARAGELPRLAAAGRGVRAGRPRRHRPDDASRSASGRDGAPGLPRRHLAVARRDPLGHRRRRSTRSCSGGPTPSSSRATSAGGRCRSPTGDRYAWDPASTYIARPPFFDGIVGRRRRRPATSSARASLAVLGDSVTTDHISPGRLDRAVVARRPVAPGARRRAARVQLVRRPARPPRGDDARHVRQHPAAQPAGRAEGGAVHGPPARRASETFIYDAAMRYATEGVPLVVIAGREYGSGSSRDWAAKGTDAARASGPSSPRASSGSTAPTSSGWASCRSSSCRATAPASLGLTGRETYSILGLAGGPRRARRVTVVADADAAAGGDGRERRFEAIARLDGPIDVDYYAGGGILPAVLRRLAAAPA